ncbi:MAG: LamG domain-containing protein [Bacteroidota bacterium]
MLRTILFAGILLTGFSFLPINDPDFESGLVAYFSFDDCLATDDLGLNQGYLRGRPNCGCGASEAAIYLDGIDDHIEIKGPVHEAFNGTYTLSFYFKTHARSIKQILLSKREACDFEGESVIEVRHLQPCGNKTTGRVWSEASPKGKRSVGVAVMEESTWRMVTIVREGTQQLIYINGQLIDTREFNHEVTDLTNPAALLLGYGPCVDDSIEEERNRYFPLIGAIDEFRVYDRPLSAEAIQALYDRAPVDLAEIGCSS